MNAGGVELCGDLAEQLGAFDGRVDGEKKLFGAGDGDGGVGWSSELVDGAVLLNACGGAELLGIADEVARPEQRLDECAVLVDEFEFDILWERVDVDRGREFDAAVRIGGDELVDEGGWGNDVVKSVCASAGGAPVGVDVEGYVGERECCGVVAECGDVGFSGLVLEGDVDVVLRHGEAVGVVVDECELCEGGECCQ